jgi:hypothetical protein
MSKVVAILSGVALVWVLGALGVFCGDSGGPASAAAGTTSVQAEPSDPFGASTAKFADEDSEQFKDDDGFKGKKKSKHHHKPPKPPKPPKGPKHQHP